MFNPFTEVASGDSDDVALVDEAKGGSRDSLEKLILRHQGWVYNIAVRMVFHPQDAEEVTQEVLCSSRPSPGSARSRATAGSALGSTASRRTTS